MSADAGGTCPQCRAGILVDRSYALRCSYCSTEFDPPLYYGSDRSWRDIPPNDEVPEYRRRSSR